MQSTENLKTKTVKSLGVVSVAQFFVRTVEISKNIVLARILLPEDFGIVAIALFITELLRQMSTPIFQSALIQKKNANERDINAGFTFGLISSLIAFVVLALIANLYDEFFHYTNIKFVVNVTSVYVILATIGFVPEVTLTRQLDFKRLVYIEGIAVICGASISIVMAYLGLGFWSIIAGIVLRLIFYHIFLFFYYISKIKIRLVFDVVIAKDLFLFGRHILLMSLLVFLVNKMPDVIIGQILGVTAVGYFVLANRWGNIITSELIQLFGRVLFPVFSSIQDRPAILKSGYLKSLKLLSLIIFPATFGLAAIAPEFVVFLFGEKWRPAVVPLQILCFSGLLRSLTLIGGEARKAIGRPDLTNICILLRFVALFSLLIPFSLMFGLIGASLAVLVASFVTCIVWILIDVRLFKISISEFVSSFKHPLLGSVIMLFSIILSRLVLTGIIDEGLMLFTLVTVGAVVYCIYSWISYPELRGILSESLTPIFHGKP